MWNDTFHLPPFFNVVQLADPHYPSHLNILLLENPWMKKYDKINTLLEIGKVQTLNRRPWNPHLIIQNLKNNGLKIKLCHKVEYITLAWLGYATLLDVTYVKKKNPCIRRYLSGNAFEISSTRRRKLSYRMTDTKKPIRIRKAPKFSIQNNFCNNQKSYSTTVLGSERWVHPWERHVRRWSNLASVSSGGN